MTNYINGKLVMFLKDENKHYSDGDSILMKENGFNNNAMFIDLEYENSKQIHIVKDCKVNKSVKLKDLIEEDFINIESIYNFNGIQLNIFNLEDIYQYIYEERKQALDLEFARIKYDRLSKNIIKLEQKKVDLENIIDEDEIKNITQIELELTKRNCNLAKNKELAYAYEKYLIDKDKESLKIVLCKIINMELYKIKEQCDELSAMIYMKYNVLGKWYK